MSKNLSILDQAQEDHAVLVRNIFEHASKVEEWHFHDFRMLMLSLRLASLDERITEKLEQDLGTHPTAVNKWIREGHCPSDRGLQIIASAMLAALEEFVQEDDRSKEQNKKTEELRQKIQDKKK